MATNVFQNVSWITNESLFLLKNAMPFIRGCNTDYQSRFTETPRKGETIKVRKPTIFTGRSGETFTAEAYTERTCDFTVQTTEGVDLEIPNRELMFNFEMFRERVLQPAMHTLANKIERAALNLATKATFNTVGTPGTIPTALKTYNLARVYQFNAGAPQDRQDRLIITADMDAEAVDAGKAFFNPTQSITDQYLTGRVGRHAGADVFESQNVISLTTGPYGGTPAVDGAAESGSTISTKGWTAAAAARLKAGDVIQFAGVYAVNQWTKQSTGKLANFVVTADFSSDGSGNGDVSISPALTATGPFQNVTAVPADSALISIYSAAAAGQAAIASKATPQGLRYHRNAFLFGSFDQPVPKGATELAHMSTDPDTSIRLRFIRDWDTENNKELNRFDVVWAFGIAYPELACRIAS